MNNLNFKNNLKLTLTPHWADGSVAAMDVFASMDSSVLNTGKECLSYLEETVSIPFAVYDSLKLWDEKGEVDFEIKELPPVNPQMKMKGIFPERKLQGQVSWSYRVYPRILPENYRSSPYFDFRAEPDGLNSAGLTFIIAPPYDLMAPMELHAELKWDLSDMPEGARGVCSLAAGDAEFDTNVRDLLFMIYACGIFRCYEHDEFGLYWFGDTPFYIDEVSERIGKLFAYMTEFFHDHSPIYRVFLRRDPFEKSGGGTAMTRSFITGYSDMTPIIPMHWFNTLAHEMVHNWTSMDDMPPGTGTWYVEGTAEYYSIVLPWRAGLISLEDTAELINDKAMRYYSYPGREKTDMELSKIFWTDRASQPVPYGRGFVYLANTEAQLKRKNAGSIDEVTTKYVHPDGKVTEEIWRSFLAERLGEEGIRDFEDMRAGKLVVPDPDSFGGLFDRKEISIELDGKPSPAYEWTVRSGAGIKQKADL